MQSFKKWIENYWYHYKFHTIIGIFLIIVIVVSSVQILSREHYDYTVVLYMSDTVPSELESAVETACEKYADDRDGNGKIKVQVLNFSYNPTGGESSYRSAQATSLMGEMQNPNTFLFITDSYRFDELNESKIFEPHDFMTAKDGAALAVKELEFGSIVSDTYYQLDAASNYNIPEMYLSTRLAPDSNKKNYIYYTGVLNMLQKASAAKED